MSPFLSTTIVVRVSPSHFSPFHSCSPKTPSAFDTSVVVSHSRSYWNWNFSLNAPLAFASSLEKP